jgi:hypothetical protein
MLSVKIYKVISVKEFTVNPKLNDEESIQEVECQYAIGWVGQVQTGTLFRLKYKRNSDNRTYFGYFFTNSHGKLVDVDEGTTNRKIIACKLQNRERNYIEK